MSRPAVWTVEEVESWNPIREFGYTHQAISPDGSRRIQCSSRRAANKAAKEENRKLEEARNAPRR